MNDSQKAWTNKKAKLLDSIISMLYPMNDMEIEAVNLIIHGIVEEAKGNEEVRSEMLDILEKWERKRKDEIKNK